MQNRIYKIKTSNTLNRCQSSQRLKFKEIPVAKDFNELNSKYEIYNNGTPNVYCDDLEMLKAKNIKEQMAMVALPELDKFIAQIHQAQKQKQINQRNYDMYPTLLKLNGNKFKDILSEKQEIKDFILWFEQQFENIQKSIASFSKKFEDKQTLIAAGFTEMASSIAKFSKNRAQILKMLWNRQQFEVKGIIEGLNSQKIKIQKELLHQISSVHNQYQQRIEELMKENKQFDEKLKKQTTFSYNCVNNLRILRKRIKKLQYAGKKLTQSSIVLKKENLHLMEQNIKLLTNIRQISEEQAVVLNYRKLQIHSLKQQLKHNQHKPLIELTRQNNQDTLTPFIDFQRKKNSLKQYFQQRIKQNPDQKVLIKEDYFIEDQQCPKSIQQYFKTVINRPNIQMELLNQPQNQPFSKDKAINTDTLSELDKQLSLALSLDKAIQVQLIDSSSSICNRLQSKWMERRVYQIIDQRQQERKEKQSKMRLIQHRISRKNSLTLLQLQNLKDINVNLLQKRNQGVSCFKKQRGIAQSKLQDSNMSSGNSDNGCSEQQSELSDQFLLQSLPHQAQLTTIKLTSPSPHRKSQNFNQFIRAIKQSCVKEQQQKILCQQELNIIKFEGQIQQELKQNQLEDLISKHLQGNYHVPSQNPEKSLNKILLTLFKNVWQKTKINFLFELLEVVKNSYGNIKSVIWKFLNAVSLIHSNQNTNTLLKIVSILLKINKNYSNYDVVNTQELAELYFQMFQTLSIKSIHDNAFNLWKCCTTFQKVRSLEFAAIFEMFFSEKKRKYIDHKINELIAVSQVEAHSKKSSKSTSIKRIQMVSEENEIIKLHPLILYILEVYLIQKQIYHSSYSDLIQFIATNDGLISVEIFLWLLEFLGFCQNKQIEIVNFALTQNQKQKDFKPLEPVKYQKSIKIEMFYRCCVKFDFPILEQIFVSTHQNFKRLPSEVQKKYYKMIRLQQWQMIKQELLRKYQRSTETMNYIDAFKYISDKLEGQIRKGSSIFRQYAESEKIKRSEQIFSFFYKMLILSAHNSLFQHEGEYEAQKRALSNIK